MAKATVAILLLGRHLGYANSPLSEKDEGCLVCNGFIPNDGIELSIGELELEIESGILTTRNDDDEITSTVDAVALLSRLPLADGALIGTKDADPEPNEHADKNQEVLGDERTEAHHYADADLTQPQGGLALPEGAELQELQDKVEDDLDNNEDDSAESGDQR